MRGSGISCKQLITEIDTSDQKLAGEADASKGVHRDPTTDDPNPLPQYLFAFTHDANQAEFMYGEADIIQISIYSKDETEKC
ncbi:hypothetical protein JTB14_034479 [Gonioctena quinquepunctata]|nr:hypothetical protein JTB14_034479 [Gonioctena quinquepunctata]